jgi:hypothetical protein
MPRFRTLLVALIAAIFLPTTPPLQAQDYGVAADRGGASSRSAQRIDDALVAFGFRPARLSRQEVAAINATWQELFGSAPRGTVLSARQATAVVYLALVHDRDRRTPERPPFREAGCDRMAADAYRLGLLITAPADNAGLFVREPELGRARTLARQLQEEAIRCRAFAVADRAGEILADLADLLPGRAEVGRRVDALKREIEAADRFRGPRR